MTSVQASYDQVPSNKLYVNIGSVLTQVYTSSLGTPTWISNQTNTSTISTALGTAGAAIFRDMGKTLYVPSPTFTPVSAAGGISTVLRKVQLVPTGTNGTYGVGGPASGLETDYYTGYIQLGALQQGGGGNGAPSRFVRLN
jgi:hypothetical protein